MSLLSVLKKVAKPLAGSIPGIGPMLSAGLGVGASLLKGKEQKNAQAANAAIQADNSAALEKRFNTGRGDAMSELQRMIAENDDINADMTRQTDDYNNDVRASRTGATQTIEGLLNEIRNSGVDIKDVADIQEFGYQDVAEGPDAQYKDVAYEEDNSDAAVLRDRTAARARGEADAIDANILKKQMMTEAGQKGPTADMLSALIAKTGGTAIARSFEDSGNKAATELTRTGGNGAATFAKLARERADALRGNDANAILAGLTGAEDLAGARASRLNPMIAALSARGTAMPDASAEMQGMAIRGQAKQNNQQMNMQGRQNVQQMNMNKNLQTKQMNVQGRAANNNTNSGIRQQNAGNKITTQGQRVAQETAKTGQLASLAPTAMIPHTMRTLAPQMKRAAPTLNMSYMGVGVGQNGQVIPENNTGSGIVEGLANLAGMIPTRDKSSVVPIDAKGMLARARAGM